MKYSILLLIVCCGAGCAVGTHRFRAAVASYVGDGQMEDASLQFAAFPSSGFRLALPPFWSKVGDEHVYRLGRLPATKETVLFFRLAQCNDEQAQSARALVADSMTMEIVDEAGVSVYRRQINSAEVRFDPRSGEGDFGASLFTFDPGINYTVRFRFVPERDSPDRQLSLIIRSGGFK